VTDDDINDILNGNEENSDMSVIEKHCTELMKKFDTVQLFCSRHEIDTGGTVNCHTGQGNFFARYGHVKQWVLKEEAQDHCGCGDKPNV
jgi:hypothetical protein